MENVTVINKNGLKVLYNKKHVELLGTTQEFKLQVIKDKKIFLASSKKDLRFVQNLLDTNKADNVEDTKGKLQSIAKRISNIKNEIGIIRNASVIDGHKLPDIIEVEDSVFIPIGMNMQKDIPLSNEQLLDKVMLEDPDTFKNKIYEILTTNNADVVLPVLKDISKEFGYKLIKIPVKA